MASWFPNRKVASAANHSHFVDRTEDVFVLKDDHHLGVSPEPLKINQQPFEWERGRKSHLGDHDELAVLDIDVEVFEIDVMSGKKRSDAVDLAGAVGAARC